MITLMPRHWPTGWTLADERYWLRHQTAETLRRYRRVIEHRRLDWMGKPLTGAADPWLVSLRVEVDAYLAQAIARESAPPDPTEPPIQETPA